MKKLSGFSRIWLIGLGIHFLIVIVLPIQTVRAAPQQDYRAFLDSAKKAKNHSQKMNFARQALNLSKNNNNRKGVASSYYEMGKLENNQGNTERADKYFHETIKIMKDTPQLFSERKKALIYKNYADNFNSMSSYHKALKYYLQSKQLAEKNGFKEIEMNTTRKIGNVYYYLNDHDKSSEHYYNSLSIAREIDNARGIALALNNIASNLQASGKLDEALENYKKALDIARQKSFVEVIGFISNNMGSIYMEKGDPESAHDYFNMGISYANKMNDYESLAIYYNNIASVYLRKEQFDEAGQFYRKSYKYYDKIGNKRGIANVYLNIANLKLKAEQQDSANFYLEKAHTINQKLNSLSITSSFYNTKHKYYMKVDSFEKALDLFKRHKKLEDSILSTDTKDKIASLNDLYAEEEQQTQYNKLKEKQQELRLYFIIVVILAVIIISFVIYAFFKQRNWNKRLKHQNIRVKTQQQELAKKNEELYESQKKLKEVDKDRNQLFSIISHDLRSPFNSLLGFSEMLVEEVRHGKDFESIEMMSENIYKSSMQLFELIQNLLEWANSERGKIQFKPENVSMHKIADENVSLANHMAQQKGVNVINNIDRSIAVTADVNMLNTIMRNLIFNSVKFTSENGYVRISAEDLNNEVKVYIEDNGMGMSQEEKDRILYSEDTFSKEGTNKEKGAGLGLVLVKSFLSKHQGQLDIESTINQGTTFSFSIPKDITT
ncbi:MAG: tetratricopeptide repeat-containing sensor histidine kinase [Bacteroidales bacterium]|nr:tetratricopeptide repeat-containing sensor histidine kinase [Bacteroidales bacterium]MCF8333118.1 tetratricopeptide repeat-containing sensor histidine kinase [Bacteroidales bacterium]